MNNLQRQSSNNVSRETSEKVSREMQDTLSFKPINLPLMRDRVLTGIYLGASAATCTHLIAIMKLSDFTIFERFCFLAITFIGLYFARSRYLPKTKDALVTFSFGANSLVFLEIQRRVCFT